MSTPTLLQQHNDWIARYKAGGNPVTGYTCPNCEKQIETPQPPIGQIFDTAATCPHCDYLHYKIVYDDGQVLTGRFLGGA